MERATAILLFTIVTAGILCAEDRSTARARYNEAIAVKLSWEIVTVPVGNAERKLIWKGPKQWTKGAIIVMHGGSGTAVDWCYATKTGIASIDASMQAQVAFSRDAIEQGFAVFSLDSSTDLVTDDKGLPCGKRFDATVVDGRENIDLPFIEKVIREVMTSKRPKGSSPSVFITGESTGGFMTVRASTHFDGLVTAFAPGAACDPYGTYFDASVDTGREARGVGIDRDTGKQITQDGAGGAPDASYPNEKKWETMNPAKKPPFIGIHHRDDGIVDITCHQKLVRQLVAHGYAMEEDFIIPSVGKKNVLAHLWQAEYNPRILAFFSKYAASHGE
ncbi:MAG: hypothetical protein AABZ39_14040 [Spirochaetota bacterium]